ncbi:MAG TPA: ABC transporter ATP-binding protein [Haliangiales bacterium]|nr:ABC transporter ATP-binding protein [Haliangiales bacterium]
MLALADVAFAYGERRVVGGVSLGAERGEIVCVIGPNGAGKTTLLRLAAGLLAPAAGSVRVRDEDPFRAPRRALAKTLAYLPQEYILEFPFTVAEVVLMGRYAHRPPLALETETDRRLAADAMRRCDVLALEDRRFDALSGGERRRALLAQAFCQAADLILLDEPTASLDPAHALAIFHILEDETRRRRACAVAVTHDLNLAARFADRVVLLDGGRATAVGPPGEVLSSDAASTAFGVALRVGALPSGTPFVIPEERT